MMARFILEEPKSRYVVEGELTPEAYGYKTPEKTPKDMYSTQAEKDSVLQNLLAGMGGAMYGLGKGPFMSPAEVKDWKASMAGLGTTGGGTAGQMLGYATPAAIAAPFVGSYVPAAAGLGLAEGAMMPAETGQERLRNMALSGGGAALGQTAGNAILARQAQKKAALAAQQALNSERDRVIAQSMGEGYKFTPSMTGAGLGSRVMEGMSGKLKANQLVGIRNQQVTDRLAKEYLGLDPRQALSDATLAAQRDALAEPYREVAALPQRQAQQATSPVMDWGTPAAEVKGFDPAKALEDLKQARFDSRMYWKAFGKEGNPDYYQNALKADQNAFSLERQIEDYAAQNGSPDLVQKLKDARVSIAKNYTIDRAMQNGRNVDAVTLGKMLDRGEKLTGKARTAAEMGRNFPDIARVPKSGDANPVTALDFMLASPSLSLGAFLSNPYLAATAIGPAALRVGMRYGMLTKPIQNTFVRPDYALGVGSRTLGNLLQSPVAPPLLQGAGIYGYGVEPQFQ